MSQSKAGWNVMHTSAIQGVLPVGVQLKPIVMHRDGRGALSEIFRADWDLPITPVQWNILHTDAGVLRGVHVHLLHTDYLVVVSGSVSVGLSDLRPGSETERTAALVELSGGVLTGLLIPPGVAHGFLFHEPCLMLHGVSHQWDPADELGCQWADPALAIPWPAAPLTLSPRDAVLPPASEVMSRILPYRSTEAV